MVTYSVQDKFGFSEADLAIRVELFTDILRPNSVIHLAVPLLSADLASNGRDLSGTLPDLAYTFPYLGLTSVTEEILPPGDVMNIVIGCEVRVKKAR